jgi:hypothetical protein
MDFAVRYRFCDATLAQFGEGEAIIRIGGTEQFGPFQPDNPEHREVLEQSIRADILDQYPEHRGHRLTVTVIDCSPVPADIHSPS